MSPRRADDNLATEFLDRHVREGRAAKTALVCEGRSWSYGELAELSNRVGSGLRQLGVQEEQRVLLVLPDGPEFVAAFFGAAKIGAVPVPTNTALRASDYAYFLDESRARVLFVDASLHGQLAAALDGRPWLRHVVVAGDSVPPHPAWRDWVAAGSAELEACPTGADDAAFWLWTSGSTGRPKAAVHRHQGWRHCCEGYARGILAIGESDVSFSSSKLFHAYGLGNALMFPFHAGASSVLCRARPSAALVLDKVVEAQPTLFFSVPTLYAAMLEHAERTGLTRLGRVRLAVSAAEPLPAEIFRRWRERFGVEILDGIGSTEVLHIYLSARPGRVKPGSTGQPVPGYAVRVVDPAGVPVAPGEIGDLHVRGESTASQYWNRSRLTRERMRGEWFVSGDKYSVDADGDYWYAGRSDDMFRVSGQWLSPVEVEAALVEHPKVLEAAVVAYRESNELHTPKAFVVLKQGFVPGSELVAELQAFVKERLAPYKYPRRIEFLAELPKSAAGKILRFELREPAE